MFGNYKELLKIKSSHGPITLKHLCILELVYYLPLAWNFIRICYSYNFWSNFLACVCRHAEITLKTGIIEQLLVLGQLPHQCFSFTRIQSNFHSLAMSLVRSEAQSEKVVLAAAAALAEAEESTLANLAGHWHQYSPWRTLSSTVILLVQSHFMGKICILFSLFLTLNS